jgi:AbrB family looped-hinge helix DNA binding protein
LNTAAKQTNKTGVALLKVTRNGQIALPADVRKTLQVKEGDYIAAETSEKEIVITPVAVVDRAETDRLLDDILSQVKYTGPEPVPSEDEIAGEVADIIREMRRDNADGGTR